MTLRFALQLVALLSAVILAALGFDLYHVSGEPYLAGWLGLSLAAWIASDVER